MKAGESIRVAFLSTRDFEFDLTRLCSSYALDSLLADPERQRLSSLPEREGAQLEVDAGDVSRLSFFVRTIRRD